VTSQLPRPEAAGSRNALPRLAAGQLTALVLHHLRSHPHTDFSPYELATVLGGRSHGTIRRTLLRLAAAGTVTRTRQRPARFAITT
jgi:DNA-binding GntR family transcriptional regulator